MNYMGVDSATRASTLHHDEDIYKVKSLCEEEQTLNFRYSLRFIFSGLQISAEFFMQIQLI